MSSDGVIHPHGGLVPIRSSSGVTHRGFNRQVRPTRPLSSRMCHRIISREAALRCGPWYSATERNSNGMDLKRRAHHTVHGQGSDLGAKTMEAVLYYIRIHYGVRNTSLELPTLMFHGAPPPHGAPRLLTNSGCGGPTRVAVSLCITPYGLHMRTPYIVPMQ